MQTLFYDLRFALRQLRKNLGFTVTAVAILALGIGANTAIFSLVHSILLRQLPFRDADRVFSLDRFSGAGLGYEMDATDKAETFRRNAQSFSSLENAAMYSVQPANFSFNDAPARLSAAEVSSQFLDVLKVKPVIGRGFAATEDTPGEDHVALISDRLWKKNFSRSPFVLGQTLHINAMTFTVDRCPAGGNGLSPRAPMPGCRRFSTSTYVPPRGGRLSYFCNRSLVARCRGWASPGRASRPRGEHLEGREPRR